MTPRLCARGFRSHPHLRTSHLLPYTVAHPASAQETRRWSRVTVFLKMGVCVFGACFLKPFHSLSFLSKMRRLRTSRTESFTDSQDTQAIDNNSELSFEADQLSEMTPRFRRKSIGGGSKRVLNEEIFREEHKRMKAKVFSFFHATLTYTYYKYAMRRPLHWRSPIKIVFMWTKR